MFVIVYLWSCSYKIQSLSKSIYKKEFIKIDERVPEYERMEIIRYIQNPEELEIACRSEGKYW